MFVRGLDTPLDPTALALPVRRALVEAVVGKQVRLVSAEALELTSFPDLRRSAVGVAEMGVSRDGRCAQCAGRCERPSSREATRRSRWRVLRGRQSRQPVLLTMNCLNGHFVGSNFESLSESLLKAEGRGAIAAFSPSGLSVDGPAHQYHRAVVEELVRGQHERLSIYHLLGDPAVRIR